MASKFIQNLKCAKGDHLWDSCICTNCGARRNEEHDYRDDDSLCVKVCARCGKQGRTLPHKLVPRPDTEGGGEYCTVCGIVVNEIEDVSSSLLLFNQQELDLMVKIMEKFIAVVDPSKDVHSPYAPLVHEDRGPGITGILSSIAGVEEPENMTDQEIFDLHRAAKYFNAAVSEKQSTIKKADFMLVAIYVYRHINEFLPGKIANQKKADKRKSMEDRCFLASDIQEKTKCILACIEY